MEKTDRFHHLRLCHLMHFAHTKHKHKTHSLTQFCRFMVLCYCIHTFLNHFIRSLAVSTHTLCVFLFYHCMCDHSASPALCTKMQRIQQTVCFNSLPLNQRNYTIFINKYEYNYVVSFLYITRY